MIRTLNLNRQTTAILENAYGIGYDRQTNSIWTAQFTLPYDDPKNEHVKLLNYVEIEDGEEYIGLFRVIPKQTTINESTREVTYQCEHVLATLLDSPMFRYHQVTGLPTKEVLEYILSLQLVPHWTVGTVAISRYFDYAWENESTLYGPVLSVAEPFDVPVGWTFDTQVYPWKLNLIEPETEPTCRIRQGHNLIGLEINENPMSFYNRVYCLGAGEGTNAVSIEKVNGGLPYVEDVGPGEDIVATIYIDKRIEDPAMLKANGLALLQKWKHPIVSWRVSAADVSSISGIEIDKLREGKVVRIEVEGFPVTDLRIVKESKPDITGSPWDCSLEIGNLTDDLGSTLTELNRRQSINEKYSQGNTSPITYNYQDNASPSIPAVIPFFMDDDIINVNSMELTYKCKPFRTYSTNTASGGSSVVTSSAGGGTSTSTQSGGEATATSLGAPFAILTSYETAHDGLTHAHLLPEGISGHTHDIQLPAHSHNVTIGNHQHSVSISPHSHAVHHEIVELAELPTAVTIKIDGNTVPQTATEGERIDLVNYLAKDESGRITRGRHQVEIFPNSLARIEADVIGRVFIQSRLGSKY